ncbi:MAG: branched-chain amino acid transaminase [Alphaproteobacteria bacterium]|nr:branched-chain amino acid transaminase [Alphaproteobacteria bacterium]
MEKKLPFYDRDGFIWMDGRMVPWREAKTHYLTHALHYGTLVFEGERAYQGKIFKSTQHSQRLLRSAEIIRIPFSSMPVDEIDRIKMEVLKANNLSNAYIRAAVWRGAEQAGVDPSGTLPHFAVAAWEMGAYYGDWLRANGLRLCSVSWRKPNPNSAPIASKASSLYNLSVLAKLEAKDKGFDDAFMLDYEGYVAESTAANIFFVMGDTLHTPIADRFLDGITRQTVLEIAADLGIKTKVRRIKPKEIRKAQEVFLTGTAAEITPVVQIDERKFINGPMVKKIMDAYAARVRA